MRKVISPTRPILLIFFLSRVGFWSFLFTIADWRLVYSWDQSKGNVNETKKYLQKCRPSPTKMQLIKFPTRSYKNTVLQFSSEHFQLAVCRMKVTFYARKLLAIISNATRPKSGRRLKKIKLLTNVFQKLLEKKIREICLRDIAKEYENEIAGHQWSHWQGVFYFLTSLASVLRSSFRFLRQVKTKKKTTHPLP